ncbi:guanine nucleotide-binding protein subunit beta-like protein 1 [Ciona intestinalis]
MSAVSPSYILYRAAPITDLNFWKSNLSEREWHLLAGYNGKSGVDAFDLVSWRPSFTMPCDDAGGMLSVSGASDAELVTLGKDGSLKLFDLGDGAVQSKVSLSIDNVAFCKASVLHRTQSSTLMVAVPGEEKSSINVWNIMESKIIKRLIPKTSNKLGMPMCVKLTKDPKLLVTVGYEDGSIFTWDVMENQTVHEMNQIFTEPVMCLDTCVNADTNILTGVTGSATNDLNRWNVQLHNTKTLMNDNKQSMKHSCVNPGIAAVKIRRDQKIIATGGWDYKVRIFGFKKLKPLACLQYHTGTVQALAFCNHPDSSKQILACGSTDQKISIWNIYNS